MAKKIRLTDHTSLDDGLPKHNIRKQINHEKIEKIEKAIDGDLPIVTKKNHPESTIVKEPKNTKIVAAKPKRGRGRPKATEEGQLTTIRFPSDLYVELKIKAFREKKTFRELVMEGLQHYLKHKK